MEMIALLPIFAAYLVINRPFLNLTCHQDAGWHSYWAAFRDKGVTLHQQLNILMGCARIGSKFLFYLWFTLLGKGDPERKAVRMFLIINILASIIIYQSIRLLTPGTTHIALSVCAAYLYITSNPLLGIHYETSERVQGFFNAVIFFSVCNYLMAPSGVWIFVIVFTMLLTAFLFKITQLIEYFALWLALALFGFDLSFFMLSTTGAVAAGAAFALLLWKLELLEKENLGILGYISSSYEHKKNAPAISLDEKIQKLESTDLHPGFIRLTKKLLVSGEKLLPAFLFRILAGLGEYILKTIQKLMPFGGQIFSSSRAFIFLIICGALLGPHYPRMETVSGIWLLGVLSGILGQGRFLPFHFIPALFPGAILAGLGLYKTLPLMTEGRPSATLLIFIIILLLDLKYLWTLLMAGDTLPLDLRLWPRNLHPVMEKNLAAREAAVIIKKSTREDNYILAWGSVPQLYVLADRRSPINWLNTNPTLMDGVLPGWREILYSRMKETKPVCIVQFDEDLDLNKIKNATGLDYQLETEFWKDNHKIFRLQEFGETGS
ncbi:MAG: hypothetical protein HOL05_05060 [Nitrospinaceae bacterium]|nr:hypothetical protein [Nitrospinaceae bacterium]